MVFSRELDDVQVRAVRLYGTWDPQTRYAGPYTVGWVL